MRAIWIISLVPSSSPTQDCVKFSKRFPTVETRFKNSFKEKYDGIPDEEDFAALFYSTLESYKEDSSSAVPILFPQNKPGLSPLVYASCCVGFVVGLPFVQLKKDKARLVLHHPDLALHLEIVGEIGRYLDEVGCDSTLNGQFWSSFSSVLSMSMPLGTLTSPLTIGETLVSLGLVKRDLAESRDSTASSDAAVGVGVMKSPSWRIVDSSAQPPKRPKLVVSVDELIECHQYDGAYGAVDTAKLSGAVYVWTDLTGNGGVPPEFTVKALVWNNPDAPSLDHKDWMGSVGYASSSICADPYDSSFACAMGAGADAKDRVCHVSICPPLKMEQSIMRYQAEAPKVLPFRGFYQMKLVAAKEAKLLIQIKLNEKVTNNFEYCSIVIPFDGIGKVESFEVSPTEGTVKKANETDIVWELGNAISGRKLECALPMSVTFLDEIQSQHSPSSSSPSCFIDLNFKILDCTLAGVKVAEEVSIHPKPSTSVNITLSNTVRSGCYRIWNSLGEVREVKKI